MGYDNHAEAKRGVGAALGIGILLLPIVFAWFTLRRGYSNVARGVSLSWMAITILIGIGASGNQSDNAVSDDQMQQDVPIVEQTSEASTQDDSRAEADAQAYEKFKKIYLNHMICYGDLSSYISAYDGFSENVRVLTLEDASKIRDWHASEVKALSGFAAGRGFSLNEVNNEVKKWEDSVRLSNDDPAEKTLRRMQDILENISSSNCAIQE